MTETDPQRPQVLVIGGGIAGGMVAMRAAAAGMSVTILEAGPRLDRDALVARQRKSPYTHYMTPYPEVPHAPMPRPDDFGDYLIQKGPDPYKQQYIRAVGGSTWHWAAAAWRLIPQDFELRSRYGVGRDWPLGYWDIEDWYLAAETEMGVSGPEGAPNNAPRSAPYPMPGFPLSVMDRTFRDRMNAAGFTVITEPVARNNGAVYDGRPPCCGNNNCMPICPIAAQYSGNIPVEKAEALGARVIENAVVRFLEVGEDRRVAAVRFLRPDGSETRIEADAFVLAANGIETPKLMLMSKQETAPEGVGNSSGEVGRNLMDHPGLNLTFDVPEPLWPGRGPQEMTSVMNLRDGPFRAEHAAKKLHLGNVPALGAVVEELVGQGVRGEELRRRVSDLAARRLNVNCFHEQLPLRENRVVPSERETDALGLPRPEIHYRYGDYVTESAKRTRETYRRIAEIMGGTNVQVAEEFFPNNHLMGTTVMGDDPRTSVCDADCVSHDHPNLAFAGSSMWPSAACVNPTLTIAALALRLGDRLATAHRG